MKGKRGKLGREKIYFKHVKFMKNTNMINITDKELDRDIRNLSIPWEDQHIPLVRWEDMVCYSDEDREIITQELLKMRKEWEEK